MTFYRAEPEFSSTPVLSRRVLRMLLRRRYYFYDRANTSYFNRILNFLAPKISGEPPRHAGTLLLHFTQLIGSPLTHTSQAIPQTIRPPPLLTRALTMPSQLLAVSRHRARVIRFRFKVKSNCSSLPKICLSVALVVNFKAKSFKAIRINQ